MRCVTPDSLKTTGKRAKDHRNMLRIILKLEGVCTEAQGWKVESKEENHEECKILREECEDGGFMAQKMTRNVVKQKVLEDKGALLKEEGDLAREYIATHEEYLLSSWLRSGEGGRFKEEDERSEMTKAEGRGEDGKNSVTRWLVSTLILSLWDSV